MRFNGLRLHNIGALRDVAVDFDAIPGLLVALCGVNGSGKSTLVEAIMGAIDRVTRTRGSLLELATSRDSFAELKLTNGKAWTIRQTVDAISKKSEALVLDDAGLPALPDSKVRSYDGWRAVHLPATEVLCNSIFLAQGSSGFLELSPGDRKGCLLRALGIEALEGKAERAREKARAAKQALDVLVARIADERQRGGDVAAAEAQLADAIEGARIADETLAVMKKDLADGQDLAQEVERKLEARRTAEAQRDHLARQRAEARDKIAWLQERIANNQKVLDEADAIRAAVARMTAIDSEIAQLKVDEAELEQKRLAHGRDAEATAQRCNEASRAIAEAEQRQRRAAARFADRATVESAAAELDTAKALDEEDERALKLLTGELENARGAGLDLAEKRLLELRPFVARVANNEIPAGDISDEACDVLAEDVRLVTEAADAPANVRRLETESHALHADVAKRRARLRKLESLAARAGEIDAAKTDLEEATVAIERGRAALAEADTVNKAARSAQTALANDIAELRSKVFRLTSERDGLKPTAAKAEPLANAEARIAELRPQLTERETLVAELTAGLSTLDWCTLEAPPEPVDVRHVQQRVESSEQRAREAHGMIAVATARLESARLTQRRLADLEGQRGALEGDLADWTLLADSLGRDGLQALEIDAAGPELTELINDLLRTCVGSRWTVTVETTRLSSDGKKQIEGCEVRVLDTERGREGTAESLSGGERVLVGEAVSLALSMLACRRAGVQGPTLIRDESGAALDPTNARNYVAMLRRAAELVGASHVLFVSHSPEVQELADARIVVKDGTVEVAA